MQSELENARKLAHGIYDDVIVAEHRQGAGPSPSASGGGPTTGPYIVLEMPEGSRVIDWAQTFEIDGATSAVAPRVGASYRLIVGPAVSQTGAVGATSGGSLRYETRNARAE